MAFLQQQYKEIEEQIRIWKIRYLFKKIGDIKESSHVKMGMIKDRNSKDLTETEEIKKRWQKYTEVLYKKGLNNFDNNNGVVTNLELYIIKCEFKWALGKIILNKVSGCDGIPAELFQILKKKKKKKKDTVNMLYSICQQI